MYPGQLEAWIATLVVEGVVAGLLAWTIGLGPLRGTAAAMVGSLMSHPIVWWMFFQLRGDIGYWPTFAVVEAFAVLSETPFYRLAGARWQTALLLSLAVNAASVLWGLQNYLARLAGFAWPW